jgi:hypothetical protein
MPAALPGAHLPRRPLHHLLVWIIQIVQTLPTTCRPFLPNAFYIHFSPIRSRESSSSTRPSHSPKTSIPGFYKAVVIRNPQVVAIVKDMTKRGQQYLGAFLLKDEQDDSDVITDIHSVHQVGVFAQITSVFAATNAPGKEDEKEEGPVLILTAGLRLLWLVALSRPWLSQSMWILRSLPIKSSPDLSAVSSCV